MRGPSGLTGGPQTQLFAIDFDIMASIDGEGTMKEYAFDRRCQRIPGRQIQQFSTQFFRRLR